MVDVIRTFVAIELDAAMQRALRDLQARLARERAARFVRWVAPENIHLTLKFFGDVEASRLPDLERAITDASANASPFNLALENLGAFPNLKQPRVVWVGLQGEIEIAARLAEKIDAAGAALGYARETRPFAPHLTLGRVKRDVSPNDSRLIGEMIENVKVGALGNFRVERVSVMKSELKPSGSVYIRLSSIELKE